MASRKRKSAPAVKRITASSRPRRNTSAPASTLQQRNTPRPMKASAQLDAFPSSDNARARQSNWRKAVVSIRLGGKVIAQLDALAEKESEGRSHWQRVRRADIINRAIDQYLAEAS